MVAKKISALPASDPLAGSELVPVVQGGATVRSTVADIWAPKLDIADNLSDVADVDEARTNLGAASILGLAAADLGGVRTVPIGDSITAGGQPSGGNNRGPWSWFVWAHLLSKGQIQHTANAGIGGNTVTQMAARFAVDVLAYSPDLVIIAPGVNGTETMANFAVAVKSMVSAAQTLGIAVVLCTVSPRTGSGATQQLVITYNAWLATYAAANHITLIDFYSLLVDPLTGNLLAAYTSDGTHPDIGGAPQKMGQLVADTLSGRLPAWVPPLAASDTADSRNLVVAGLLRADANADGLADNWNVTGAAGVKSLIEDPSIPGNWQRITDPACTTTSTVRQTVPTIPGLLVAGHRYAFCCRVAWDISATGGKPTILLVMATSRSPLNELGQGSAVGDVIVYDEFVFAGATPFELHLRLGAGGGGSGWVQFAQPTLLDLTDLGVEAAL